MSQREWYTAEVIAARPAREAIEYGLMEAGAAGTETDDASAELRIIGYFENPIDQNKINETLVDALRIYLLTPDNLIRSRILRLGDRDWLAEWKKHWQPIRVGRFIVAPPWHASVPGATATEPLAVASGLIRLSKHRGSLDPVATAPGSDTSARGTGTITIRINPGMAFGTGTHETTRLCLKAIDKYFRGGSFLDVGTGTGILAIAAAKICQNRDRETSPASIMACDTDVEAIQIARENAELNLVADQIDFHVGTVDEETPSADFVCANLTAPVIVELLPALFGATCGRLALSGILDSQLEPVRSRLMELGVTNFEVEQDGEWLTLVV